VDIIGHGLNPIVRTDLANICLLKEVAGCCQLNYKNTADVWKELLIGDINLMNLN